MSKPLTVKPVQVRISAELHQWIREQAGVHDRSANWIINDILDRARRLDQERTQVIQQFSRGALP